MSYTITALKDIVVTAVVLGPLTEAQKKGLSPKSIANSYFYQDADLPMKTGETLAQISMVRRVRDVSGSTQLLGSLILHPKRTGDQEQGGELILIQKE